MSATNCRCDECGELYVVTPSGGVCPNGHGRVVLGVKKSYSGRLRTGRVRCAESWKTWKPNRKGGCVMGPCGLHDERWLAYRNPVDANSETYCLFCRIAVLEEALRPFAAASSLLPDHPDGADIEYMRYLTMRLPNDLRAAAAAMEGRT